MTVMGQPTRHTRLALLLAITAATDQVSFGDREGTSFPFTTTEDASDASESMLRILLRTVDVKDRSALLTHIKKLTPRAAAEFMGKLRKRLEEASSDSPLDEAAVECDVIFDDFVQKPFVATLKGSMQKREEKKLPKTNMHVCQSSGIPSKERMVVAYCDSNSNDVLLMIGTSLYAGAEFVPITTLQPVSAFGLWDGPNGKPPDVIICTSFEYLEALTKARKQLQSDSEFKGRYVIEETPTTGAIVWPKQTALDENQPAYRRGQWPLIVGMDLEAWSTGTGASVDVMVASCDPTKPALTQRPNPNARETGVLFSHSPTLYLPAAIASFARRQDNSLADLIAKPVVKDRMKGLVPTKQKKFCAFMYSNCGDAMDSAVRIAFFKILSKYKRVDAIGGCMNNMGRQEEAIKERYNLITRGTGTGFYDIAVARYREYKFVITFENSQHPGYITEKLINPILAGSIPIYWGVRCLYFHLHLSCSQPIVYLQAPDVAKYVNTERMIPCMLLKDDYRSKSFEEPAYYHQNKSLAAWPRRIEKGGNDKPEYHAYQDAIVKVVEQDENVRDCLERIKELDNDDAAYEKVLMTPFLHGNELSGIFNLSRVGEGLREVMAAAELGSANNEKRSMQKSIDRVMSDTWNSALDLVNEKKYDDYHNFKIKAAKRGERNVTNIEWTPGNSFRSLFVDKEHHAMVLEKGTPQQKTAGTE
jgi:hypothetical protein